MSLAYYVRKVLLSLRHVNGNHVCTLYGLNDPEVSTASYLQGIFLKQTNLFFTISFFFFFWFCQLL